MQVRRNLGVFVVALASYSSVACASSSTSLARIDRSEFHSNINTWSLPLDQYLAVEDQITTAASMLSSSCMATKGYTFPAFDYRQYQPPNRNSENRRLFNLGLARTYGYHSGQSKLPPDKARYAKLSSAESIALKGCQAMAGRKVYPAQSSQSFVESLEADAYSATYTSDPAVTRAAEGWKRCMLPIGIPDLPQSPSNMPSPSQQKEFGLHVANNGPASVQTKASPREIEQAVADAKCQLSSGYYRLAYATEIRNQFSTMDKHAAQLDQILSETQKVMAVARKVIEAGGR